MWPTGFRNFLNFKNNAIVMPLPNAPTTVHSAHEKAPAMLQKLLIGVNQRFQKLFH